MQYNKFKFVIILFFCFLGASITAFILQRNNNLIRKDLSTDKTEVHKQNDQKSVAEQQSEPQTTETDSQTQSDNIEDLEILLGDLIEGDIGDALDMVWSNREITSDFKDRNEIAEEVKKFPILSNVEVSEEQLDLLRNCITEIIFNNGNNDYDSYLNFIRKSGETIPHYICELARKSLIGSGTPEEEIPDDPWKLLSEDLKDRKKVFECSSMWKGLVSEGSQIKLFESQTSQLPLGDDLYDLRGGMTTFRDLTDPPISLDETIKTKGKVTMADVQIFIAHEDLTGGVVWPYIIRYWFDPINKLWRVERAALFQNRHTSYRIYILP
jgi:hypothetical protein